MSVIGNRVRLWLVANRQKFARALSLKEKNSFILIQNSPHKWLHKCMVTPSSQKTRDRSLIFCPTGASHPDCLPGWRKTGVVHWPSWCTPAQSRCSQNVQSQIYQGYLEITRDRKKVRWICISLTVIKHSLQEILQLNRRRQNKPASRFAVYSDPFFQVNHTYFGDLFSSWSHRRSQKLIHLVDNPTKQTAIQSFSCRISNICEIMQTVLQ